MNVLVVRMGSGRPRAVSGEDLFSPMAYDKVKAAATEWWTVLAQDGREACRIVQAWPLRGDARIVEHFKDGQTYRKKEVHS